MFFGLFSDAVDVLREFSVPAAALDGANVLVAWYEYEDYSGDAFVLYEKDGKLFEVNGSHCSCNGLEDQWSPEETSWEVLAHIVRRGTKFCRDDEACARLAALVDEHVPIETQT